MGSVQSTPPSDQQPSPSDIDDARRVHSYARDTLVKGAEFAIKSASDTIKMLATLNAGGIIALLGFIGAVAGKERQVFATIEPFIRPISFFGYGLVAAALASGGMYWAQWLYAIAPQKMKFNYVHPFIHSTKAYKKLSGLAIFFHVLAATAGLASLVLFLVGLWNCRALLLGAKL